MAFKIPYVYDYKIKLCRTQAEVILNHVNANVRDIGQGEARQRKLLSLTVVRPMIDQLTDTFIHIFSENWYVSFLKCNRGNFHIHLLPFQSLDSLRSSKQNIRYIKSDFKGRYEQKR
jgi:hypothetical protein